MRQKITPSAAPAPSGLNWIKLQLSSFTAFRDSIPVLSAPATQAADGLITWPCNAPSDYSDLPKLRGGLRCLAGRSGRTFAPIPGRSKLAEC